MYASALLLTSDGLIAAPVRELASQLLGRPWSGTSSIVVTTASRKWKERNRNTVRARDVLETLGSRVSYLDFDADPPARLQEADVIYISGGNPFYLLESTRKSGADREFHSAWAAGKLLIGTSAGTLLFGPDLTLIQHLDPGSNTSNRLDLTCLNIFEFYLMPHYARWVEERPGTDEQIRDFERKYGQRVVQLNDGQAVGRCTGDTFWA